MIFKRNVFLLFLFVAFISCTKREGDINKNSQRRVNEPLTISVEKPKKELIELVIETTGTLYAIEESNVSFEVDGKVVEVIRDLGDFVKRGDVLARVSPEEYLLKKAQSEADFKNAEIELKRVEELYEKKFATEQQLDIARRNLNVAKAQYDLALKKLSDCNLKSPINGFVAKRMINMGDYVRTGTVSFYIVNSSILKFKTEIPEKYSGYIKTKDRVVVEVASGEEVEGYVYRISPAVNSDSRAFPVEVRIENKDNILKPGSFAKGRVFASYKYPALTISEGAVTFFSGIPKVFKIVDSKAIEQKIVIKERVGRRFVVESGITEDDTIASTLTDVLIDKQPVRVKE